MEHRLKSVAIMTLRERYFGFLQKCQTKTHHVVVLHLIKALFLLSVFNCLVPSHLIYNYLVRYMHVQQVFDNMKHNYVVPKQSHLIWRYERYFVSLNAIWSLMCGDNHVSGDHWWSRVLIVTRGLARLGLTRLVIKGCIRHIVSGSYIT